MNIKYKITPKKQLGTEQREALTDGAVRVDSYDLDNEGRFLGSLVMQRIPDSDFYVSKHGEIFQSRGAHLNFVAGRYDSPDTAAGDLELRFPDNDLVDEARSTAQNLTRRIALPTGKIESGSDYADYLKPFTSLLPTDYSPKIGGLKGYKLGGLEGYINNPPIGTIKNK